MKKVLLTIVVAAGLVLATATLPAHGSITAAPACAAGQLHPALMTVKRLHMRAQPIGYGGHDLARGPIWDPDFNARPGQGRSMVIRGHDVTHVPGYGKHGPFYRLPSMHRGDLATIRRCGVLYTYKYVRNFTHWQCSTKSASIDPRRYLKGPGELLCFTNNTPIKQHGVETLYFRCCWPRYTMNKFFYVRLALVSAKPVS
jgi:hypothetical protein